MMLVVHKQRISAGVSLRRLTVKVSSSPSNRLAAASGYCCCSHLACCLSLAILPQFRPRGSTEDAAMISNFSSWLPLGEFTGRFSFALALEPVQGATDQSVLLCSPSCWWVYYATQTGQT